MEKSIYEQIILKNFKSLKKEKYVIYGTKDVGIIYYNEIVKQVGEESIAFFIDGKKESDYFKGKAVYQCNEINNDIVNVNDYKYVLGTVSKIPLFINNLKKIGVREENIIDTIKYFSADYIDSDINIIKNLFIYPPVENQELLDEIIKLLDNYIIVPKDSEQKVNIYSTCDTKLGLPYGYEVIEEDFSSSKIHEDDMVLVWDFRSLMDKDLKSITNVLCFDEKFVVHLSSKILSAVMSKFVSIKSENYYKELSRQHYMELLQKSKQYKSVLVCGTGPSLKKLEEDFVEILERSLVLVCNGFYKTEGSIQNVNPDVYVLQDNIWLSCEYREEMDKIIDYVVRRNIYLCVEARWLSICCTRYPKLEPFIIGLSPREYDVFPSVDNLEYTMSENVITSMGIPIASSLCEQIYIIGCDGVKKGEWVHVYSSESESGFDIYKKSFLHPPFSAGVNAYGDYLNILYKRVLNYGESMGKVYVSLKHSYIEELKKRCKINNIH